MNAKEQATIKECISSSKIHREALSKRHTVESINADIIYGMTITIAKLESLLTPAPKKKPCKGCRNCHCEDNLDATLKGQIH